MMEYRNIRDVYYLPNDSSSYICTIDLFADGIWFQSEYCARPGGGGICDAIIQDISNGNYQGEMKPWKPEATE